MEYTSFDSYMKQRFGGKVYRLSLSTGCTCPNRDGSCGTGGCIFCSGGGSGEFASGPDSKKTIAGEDIALSVNLQIEEAKSRVASKLSHNFAGYMAYFQSFSNTYFRTEAEFVDVKARFFAAAKNPEVLAISIATRPDCLPDYVLNMLAALNQIKPVTVELGLQTIHEKTAVLINRGYESSVYDKAVADLHAIGIGVVTHMIIGLPGETEDMMVETLKHIVKVSVTGAGSGKSLYKSDSNAKSMHLAMPDGIKLQLLHVLKSTRLNELNNSGAVCIHNYSLEEYALLLCRLVPLIPKEMVVHRLTGDPPKNLLISPLWTADKKKVINTINKYLSQ